MNALSDLQGLQLVERVDLFPAASAPGLIQIKAAARPLSRLFF
jgi:hypothetical protein